MSSIGFDPGAFAAGAHIGANMTNGLMGFADPGDSSNGPNNDPNTGAPMTLLQRFANARQAQNDGGVEQLQANATKAKALRGVLSAYADAMDDDDAGAALKAKAHTMGLGDLEGFIQGQTATQAADLNAAKTGRYDALAAAAKADQDQQAQKVAAMRDYFTGLDAKLNPPTDLDGAPMRTAADAEALKAFSPADRVQIGLLAKIARSNPQGLPAAAEAMKSFAPTGGQTQDADSFFKPTDSPVDDLSKYGLPNTYRIKTGKNTSQVVIGGQNAGDAVTITDDNGDVKGYGLRTKNGVTPIKTDDMTESQRQNLIQKHVTAMDTLTTQAAKITAAAQNPASVSNIVAQINDRMDTHKQAIAGLQGKGGAPGKPAAAGKPSAVDVTYLAQHPEMKEMFEQKFGKGSAAKYLP